MHCLPFKDRSRAIRPEERRRESLHAHHGSQRAQSLWRTRGRGRQDHHESHGNANSAGRIESDRRSKVLSSNRRHAVRGNDAQHADDDSNEGDEQHGNSHVPPICLSSAFSPARVERTVERSGPPAAPGHQKLGWVGFEGRRFILRPPSGALKRSPSRVTNGHQLYHFFSRYAPTDNSRFETTAAINAGNAVRDELRAL